MLTPHWALTASAVAATAAEALAHSRSRRRAERRSFSRDED
jgi:hypothetical protein